MGKIKQGLLGGFSGKVGPVVGSSWKGIAVIKSMPLSVANPRTASQVNNRVGFAFVVALSKTILVAVLKPLLDRFAVKMSGYNLFMQRNRDYWDETGIINYADINISEGNVTAFENLALDNDSANDGYLLTWDNNTGVGDALATDEAYGFVVNVTQDDVVPFVLNTARSTGTMIVAENENIEVGDVVHVYVAFRRADGTKASNTSYVTDTML